MQKLKRCQIDPDTMCENSEFLVDYPATYLISHGVRPSNRTYRTEYLPDWGISVVLTPLYTEKSVLHPCGLWCGNVVSISEHPTVRSLSFVPTPLLLLLLLVCTKKGPHSTKLPLLYIKLFTGRETARIVCSLAAMRDQYWVQHDQLPLVTYQSVEANKRY
jgi:hypothetical protein